MRITPRQIDLTASGDIHANWQTLLSWGNANIGFEMPSRPLTSGRAETIQIVHSFSWLRDLVSWKAGFAVYGMGNAEIPRAMVVGRWADPESGRESSHYIMQRGLALLFGDASLVGTDLCRGYFRMTPKSGLTAVTITSLTGHSIYESHGKRELSAAAQAAESAFLSLERSASDRVVVDFAKPEHDRSDRFSGFWR